MPADPIPTTPDRSDAAWLRAFCAGKIPHSVEAGKRMLAIADRLEAARPAPDRSDATQAVIDAAYTIRSFYQEHGREEVPRPGSPMARLLGALLALDAALANVDRRPSGTEQASAGGSEQTAAARGQAPEPVADALRALAVAVVEANDFACPWSLKHHDASFGCTHHEAVAKIKSLLPTVRTALAAARAATPPAPPEAGLRADILRAIVQEILWLTESAPDDATLAKCVRDGVTTYRAALAAAPPEAPKEEPHG